MSKKQLSIWRQNEEWNSQKVLELFGAFFQRLEEQEESQLICLRYWYSSFFMDILSSSISVKTESKNKQQQQKQQQNINNNNNNK